MPAEKQNKVHSERIGPIAVLRIASPSGNILTQSLRADMMNALEKAAGTDCEAIVLCGGQNEFCRGIALSELEQRSDAPTTYEIANKIELLEKPVVAAIAGRAIGAGFELALACAGRVVQENARVGLPDFGIGLTPGAGGSQRLPRIVGAKTALDILLSTRTLPAKDIRIADLFDAVVEDDPLPSAMELAKDLAANGWVATRDRREGFSNPAAFQNAVAKRREAVAGSPYPVARDIVACVEAALLLPFEAGLALEGEVFADSKTSGASQSLRHVLKAQQRSSYVPPAMAKKYPPIQTVGIIGGGQSAAGIARLCLEQGLAVRQFDRKAVSLSLARVRLAGSQEKDEAETALLRRWKGTSDLNDLKELPFIIEAVADVPRTKAKVFTMLESVVDPTTILGTQTGLLSIDEIASSTVHPERVVGLHFHAPAATARLTEVIAGKATDPEVVNRLMVFSRAQLRRIVLRNGTGGGSICEPVVAAAREAGIAMLSMGVSMSRIDHLMAQWGMPHGVFRQMDIIGTDVVLARGQFLRSQQIFPSAHLQALSSLVEAGHRGRHMGRGFYHWDEDGHPEPITNLPHILFDAPVKARDLSDDEIKSRILSAMANTGARLLEAGLVKRPQDIDLACVLGVNFPRWRGGPMKAADLRGLFAVEQDLKQFAADWPELYTPGPMFFDLVKNGENFDTLNRQV